MEIPFALAFTAGLVATLNPCGFAMLPAYLAYFAGLDGPGEVGTAGPVGRALRVGATVSLGFMLVFGVAGLLISAGVGVVVEVMPWIALVVGVGLAAVGIAVVAGLELSVRLPGLRGSQRGGTSGALTFGISYAVASLSCTLPVFLVVVAGTIPQLGLISGLVTFLVYALGMTTMLLLVTLALALGRRTIVDRLRASGRFIERLAGAILALAGGYIVFYWATTLSGDAGPQPAAVVSVELLASRATNLATDHAGVVATITAVALVAAGATMGRARRRRGRSQDQPVSSTGADPRR
ncbi:MAG: cytochrome c biogenesis CcdA family protein [Actinomycetota bacterium]